MRFLIILFSLVLSSCATVDKTTAIDSTTQRYNTLIADLKHNIVLEKISEARDIYLGTTYSSLLASETQLSLNIETAISDGQWQSCLNHTTNLLTINYLNIAAHYGAMVCQYELQETGKSDYHQQMLNMILEAIWHTGDGESRDTAFYVINEHDMMNFIEFHGLELHSHSKLTKTDRYYIISQLVDTKSQQHFQWYFWLTPTQSPN